MSVEARARFDQGITAYKQGRFRAAVEHFKAADRLAPSPRLSFNMAIAYERLDDAPNALAAYRDYLRRWPDAENASETAERIDELERVLQGTGVQQATVISTPSGAEVTVDGASRGVTPWTGELPPGSHELSLRLRDHQDVKQRFELPADHAIDIILDLEPAATDSKASATAAPQTLAAPLVPTVDERKPRWWTWAAFAGSATCFLASGALELSRRGVEAELKREELDQFAIQDRWDAMDDRKVAARWLAVIGGVAAAAGGVSLYLDLTRYDGEEPGLALACDIDQCRALARGTW